MPAKDDSWPFGIHAWARQVAEVINDWVRSHPTDKVILERANSSSWRDSQNFIDWHHFAVIQKALDNNWADKLVYINSVDWRRKIGLQLNKEQKKQNQLISKEKRKGNKVVKVNGKRVGRITRKHLSVISANNLFNLKLKLKDNDIADALNCAYSYFL